MTSSWPKTPVAIKARGSVVRRLPSIAAETAATLVGSGKIPLPVPTVVLMSPYINPRTAVLSSMFWITDWAKRAEDTPTHPVLARKAAAAPGAPGTVKGTGAGAFPGGSAAPAVTPKKVMALMVSTRPLARPSMSF